jgi:hypothetical protein
MTAHLNTTPFKSFWWGGYECTDQLNCFGNRVDFLPLTGHLQMLDEDYTDLKPFGVKTVREGIRWAHIEKTPYHYDWSTVKMMLDAGQRHGIQQVWDMCHFGFPDDLTPLHPMFARRFAALCRAFVDFYRSERPEGVLVVTPINEVSFLSWAGGEVRATSPYGVRLGWEVKYALMRAYIEGVVALREADPGIRILTTEPLVSIVPPHNPTPRQRQEAKQHHEWQYQATDILAGRVSPELGGRPELLDIMGFNFYYDNQWDVTTGQRLGWNDPQPDSRLRPLRDLFKEAHRRYNRPIALTETSHPGIDRPLWLKMIGRECAATLQQGIPLLGVCLYPIIDRPDWDFLDNWHHSGMWDAALRPDGPPHRILHQPSAEALLAAQASVAQVLDRKPALALS